MVGAGEGLTLIEHLHTADSVFRTGFHGLTESSPQLYDLGTMIIPSLQMGKLH